MALATRCPECDSSLRIDERVVGHRVRCPKCRHAFRVSSVSFDQNESAASATQTMSSKTVGPAHGSTVDAAYATKGNQNDQRSGDQGEFGRFQLKAVLGQGTYGKVYRAFDPILDREIALKVPKFSGDQARMIERFLREAKSAARLRHPNIVGVFESGNVGDDYYIASEFVNGGTLEAAMKQGPIDPAQAARWCHDLADGLAYAHESGVVHRDIKPGNVLLDDLGRPRIADFGLAKRIGEDATMTTEGSLLGTPAYMSPEQARGQTDKIGPASDQYSLAAMMYEMLCGRRPYEGPPHIVIAKAAGQQPPPSPRSIRPSIPRDLEAICLRALEKVPSQRYPNVQRMADDLQRWLDGTPVLARPIGAVERLSRWCRRNPVLSMSLAVTFGLIIAAVGGAFTRVVVQLERAQQVAVEARKTAQVETAASLASQRQLAINEFERGRNLCERGELTQGLLWLSSSLNNLTPETSDLERPIRSYIGSWLPHVHHLRLMIPHDGRVNSVAISPDGKVLLTGTGAEKEPGRAQLWDLATGAKIGSPVEHAAGVTQVAFSPNGSLFATASHDKQARLFEAATGRVIHTLIHPDGVCSVGFSPDGKRLATGSYDEFARLWDVESGSAIALNLHHPRAQPGSDYNERFNKRPKVDRVVFSPDGASLATSSGDQRLRIWDLASGTIRTAPIRAYQGGVIPIAYHPDGKKLLTHIELHDPVGAQFRDVATLNPLGPMFNQKDSLTSVQCSSNGRLVLTSGESSARIWDAETGEPLGQSLAHTDKTLDVCFSRDQSLVVTAGADRTVRVWKLAEKPLEGRVVRNNNRSAVQFLPDGRSYLESDAVTPDPEGPAFDNVRIRDAQTDNQLFGPYGHPGILSSVAFTLDGTIYARGNWNSAEVRRTDTGKEVHEALIHPERVRALAFSPDETILVTGCGDGWVRFWDRAKRTIIEPSLRHQKRIDEIQFTRDGKLLLTVSESTVRLWDWKTRAQVGPTWQGPHGVRAAELHPNDKVVAVASNDDSVRFWNVDDGAPLTRLISNLEQVIVMRFTPDGRSLVTSGGDGATRIWDYETCLPAARTIRRNGRVRWTDINRDGTLIATSGSDPTVRIYDMPKQIDGSPGDVRKMLERMLGAELVTGQHVRVLDATEWRQRAGADAAREPEPLPAAPFDAAQARQLQETWARKLRVPVEFENSLGAKFRLIPPGEFLMGAPDNDPLAYPQEKSQRRVRLTHPFYIGVHEITRGQFAAFVSATGFQTDAERNSRGASGPDTAGTPVQDPKFNWRTPGFEQNDRHPVVDASWNDTQAFCQWLSNKEGKTYQLPTSAEWEYACRAGTTTRLSNGDDAAKLPEIANFLSAEYCETIVKHPPRNEFDAMRDGYAVTAPVGTYRPNPFGLCDMHGNVWEWTRSYYQQSHTPEMAIDPAGPETGTLREIRGGAFECPFRYLRSSQIDQIEPAVAHANIGFRVMQVIAENEPPHR